MWTKGERPQLGICELPDKEMKVGGGCRAILHTVTEQLGKVPVKIIPPAFLFSIILISQDNTRFLQVFKGSIYKKYFGN